MSTRRGTVSDEDTEFMKQLDESFASINDSSARLANLICCEEIPIDSRALRCLEAQLKSISNTIKLVKAGMKILPSPSCEIQKPM